MNIHFPYLLLHTLILTPQDLRKPCVCVSVCTLFMYLCVCRVMENEEGRKEYLVFPPSKNQCPSQKGRKIPLKGNGRRIDYILYKEDSPQQDWKVV